MVGLGLRAPPGSEEVNVLTDRMRLFSNKLLSCTQHGFVKGRSTAINLMEAMNDWTLTLQDKQAVTIAYSDFSRAFDSVSHNK